MSHIKLPPLSQNPLVSIIVPSFNQGSYIRETIDSIISQDYRPLEIIIIDGASIDNTIDVLLQYDDVPEVKWISEPDGGVVEAVNKGFKMANGEIGAIQSSDDYYLPGALKTGVNELCGDPRLGFVFGDIVKIDENGNELTNYKLKSFSVENILSLQTWIPQPSCFFRLQLAKALGGWREEIPYAADTDLWFQMMLKSDAKKIDAVLAKRRMHGEQRDIHGDRIIRDYSQMITDFFEKFKAPSELRGVAEAGVLLITNRYSYGEPEKIKYQRMRKAIKLYSPLKTTLKVPSRIPGINLGRALLKRVLILFIKKS